MTNTFVYNALVIFLFQNVNKGLGIFLWKV